MKEGTFAMWCCSTKLWFFLCQRLKAWRRPLPPKMISQDINDNLCCTKIFFLPNDVKQRFMPHPLPPLLPLPGHLHKTTPQDQFLTSACAKNSSFFVQFFSFLHFVKKLFPHFCANQICLLAQALWTEVNKLRQWSRFWNGLSEFHHVDLKSQLRCSKETAMFAGSSFVGRDEQGLGMKWY